jgi:hypothetical protein
MSDNDKVICPNCVHEFVAVPVNVQAKVAQLEEDYGRACKLVADMHGAATGKPGDGPRRGVVEDVADLRAALVLVMGYPDVRKYLGRQVSEVADAVLGAA